MTTAPLPGFTFAIDQTFATLDSGWRAFPGHYLLYAARGAFHLEVDRARWLLPPHRAAWIAAGVSLRVSTTAPVACRSVLFAPAMLAHLETPAPCRVFAVSPLAREMLAHAMRWGRDRDPRDPVAERFFLALGDVCAELAARPDQFWLPRARSPELERAFAYVLARLEGEPALGDAARAARVSSRTLARRFAEETELTYRQFVQRARLIRAMELLAAPGAQVTAVAYATGFASPSAFTTAFRAFTGETPSQHRARYTRGGAAGS